ncbi:unnamed protein product [Lota lota]
MERSATVCHYCGVSYLILHEFQRLQARLAQVEAELQGQREEAGREKAQRESLELGRAEWERALRLELGRHADVAEELIREELGTRNEDTERGLREELALREERSRREMEEEFETRRLKREDELEKIWKERERRQSEELELGWEEREKVLSQELLNTNNELDGLRKYLQQLEGRMAGAMFELEETTCIMGKEKERHRALRLVCGQQQYALQETISLLRTSRADITDIQGFLGQLEGAWQDCRSQVLQLSGRIVSELREELKNSSLEIWKTRAEKANLDQQVQEQRRRGEELSQQRMAEKHKHQGDLSRLSEELKEKDERWLSCQLRCESLCKELLAWQQREKQQVALRTVAEEEVTSLKKAQENLQQEAVELKRERECMGESHSKLLASLEMNFRQQMASELAAALDAQSTQNALGLKKQKAELCREAELEMMIDREKSQLLLLKYQQDITQLQSKLEDKEGEALGLWQQLQQDRRSGEEQRSREEEEMRRGEEETRRELEHSRREEALELSGAKAELRLLTNQNAGLQQEVALLQETVRRECQERGDLTAALTQAQEQLLQGQRHTPVPRLLPSRPQDTQERPGSLDKEQRPPQDPSTNSLARHSKPQNSLRPSPPPHADKEEGGWGRSGSTASWDGEGEVGQWGGKGEVRAKGKGSLGSLPRLSATSTTREVQRKVSLMMGKTDRA